MRQCQTGLTYARYSWTIKSACRATAVVVRSARGQGCPTKVFSMEAAASSCAPVRDADPVEAVRRAIAISVAHAPAVRTLRGVRPARQPEAGQRHADETDAEFLQRPTARD